MVVTSDSTDIPQLHLSTFHFTTERTHWEHHYGQQQVISFQVEKRAKQQQPQQQPGDWWESVCEQWLHTSTGKTGEKCRSVCCSHCGWPRVSCFSESAWQTVLLWEQVIKRSHRIYLCFVRGERISKQAARPPQHSVECSLTESEIH